MAEIQINLHDTFPLDTIPHYDEGFYYDDPRLFYNGSIKSDQVGKSTGINRSDTLTISEEIAKQIETAFAEQLGITDASFKEIDLGKVEAFSLSDSYAKRLGLSKSDTLALADSIAKEISLSKEEAMAIADTLSRAVAYQRSLADSVDIADKLEKTTVLTKQEAISITDIGLTKSFGLNMFELLEITDIGFTYYVPGEKAVLFVGKESVVSKTGEIRPLVKIFATTATEVVSGEKLFYDSDLYYDTAGLYYDRWHSATGEVVIQGERPEMTVGGKGVKINIGKDKPVISLKR
ncbi:MAG: hypothetical protein PHH57_07175 [Candidatus Omnitrophica bacterium]|nr:hypothetical protein [Candidatus Omnitrophota bacterium]